MLPKPESSGKGDPKEILNFLKKHGPISKETADKIIAEVKKGRKRAVARKFNFEEQ